MEKGRHLASYAYEYVPRSRPLFARIHTFERGVIPSEEILFCEILLAERSETRGWRFSFGKSLRMAAARRKPDKSAEKRIRSDTH